MKELAFELTSYRGWGAAESVRHTQTVHLPNITLHYTTWNRNITRTSWDLKIHSQSQMNSFLLFILDGSTLRLCLTLSGAFINFRLLTNLTKSNSLHPFPPNSHSRDAT